MLTNANRVYKLANFTVERSPRAGFSPRPRKSMTKKQKQHDQLGPHGRTSVERETEKRDAPYDVG
jgi:hypothetical protein